MLAVSEGTEKSPFQKKKKKMSLKTAKYLTFSIHLLQKLTIISKN